MSEDIKWIKTYDPEDKGFPAPITPKLFEDLYTVDYKQICPKCNLDLSHTMGYVCSRGDCPIQLKIT